MPDVVYFYEGDDTQLYIRSFRILDFRVATVEASNYIAQVVLIIITVIVLAKVTIQLEAMA